MLQCPTRAPWEAKFPLWVTSCGSPCPCRCPRCSCGVTAAPGLGAAPPVPTECGSQRVPDPARSFWGAWAPSARPALGACAQAGGVGDSPGLENMTKGHARPLRGPLARALPVLGSCPQPPLMSWRGRIVPVPRTCAGGRAGERHSPGPASAACPTAQSSRGDGSGAAWGTRPLPEPPAGLPKPQTGPRGAETPLMLGSLLCLSFPSKQHGLSLIHI